MDRRLCILGTLVLSASAVLAHEGQSDGWGGRYWYR